MIENKVFDIAVGMLKKEFPSTDELKQLGKDFTDYADTGKMSPLVERFQKKANDFISSKNLPFFDFNFKGMAVNSAMAHLIETDEYGNSVYEIAKELIRENFELIQSKLYDDYYSYSFLPASVIDEYERRVTELGRGGVWNSDKMLRVQLLTCAWFSLNKVGDNAYDSRITLFLRSKKFGIPFTIYSIIPFIAMTWGGLFIYIIVLAVKNLSFRFGMEVIHSYSAWQAELIKKYYPIYFSLMFSIATIINYYVYQYFFG